MKAWIFIVQTCHEVRQTELVSGASRIIENADINIKLQKFGQRFAISSDEQLHAHNEHQFSKLGIVQRVAQHDATHLDTQNI